MQIRRGGHLVWARRRESVSCVRLPSGRKIWLRWPRRLVAFSVLITPALPLHLIRLPVMLVVVVGLLGLFSLAGLTSLTGLLVSFLLGRIFRLRLRLFSRSHQVHTALQRHRPVLSLLRPTIRLCSGPITADTLHRNPAQILEPKRGATRGRMCRRLGQFRIRSKIGVPRGTISSFFEGGSGHRRHESVVAVIDIVPAVN